MHTAEKTIEFHVGNGESTVEISFIFNYTGKKVFSLNSGW